MELISKKIVYTYRTTITAKKKCLDGIFRNVKRDIEFQVIDNKLSRISGIVNSEELEQIKKQVEKLKKGNKKDGEKK